MNIKSLFSSVVLSSLVMLSASIANAVSQDVVFNEVVIWSDAGGNNIIRVTTPTQSVVNSWGCLDPDSYMVRSTLAKETQARVYATLLTAKALEKPITARIDGCESNRPAIVSVYF